MNLDAFTSGMPCCRYVLMKLKHEEEARCFTKFVVRTLHSIEMPANDIFGVLAIMSTTLPFSHPLLGYDFSSFPGIEEGVDPEEFVKRVMADDTIASYSRCYEYCKTVDKSTKFCTLCPLSRYYNNGCLKEEMELIRFAMDSMENLDYLLSSGLNDKCFTSVVDIHGSLRLEPGVIEKPFVFSFCSLIWQQLVADKDAGLYEKSYEERMLYVKSKILDIFIGKYSRVFDRTSSISESVCSIQVETIAEKRCPSQKEVDRLLSVVMKEKEEPKISYAANDSNIKSSNIVDFYSKKQLSGEGLKTKKDPADDNMQETVVIPEDVLTTSCDEEPVSFETPQEDAADTMLPAKINDEVNEDSENSSSTYDGTADDLSFRELGYVYKASSVLYDKSDKAGFLGVPIVKKDELEHFSLDLDNSKQRVCAMMESQTLNDTRLCIELVVLEDKKTYFLLLFSPKLHAYYHTSLQSKYVKDVITSLLTYPSITKYCYYPYFVASFLMKAGIYVKSLKSLFSLSAIVYGQHNLLIDECLDNMGAYKAEGGVHVKPKGEITSLPLLYMHCYAKVYQRLSKELTAKGLLKELEERNCFDVLLGRYYYQDLYSLKSAVLFTLRDSVGYHFLNEELEYKKNGYVLTYTFKHLPLNLSHLLRELLCRMENKGYFKKYGAMITGVGPSSFSLFVVKEDMRKLDTLIDTTLVFFLRDNELYGVRYSLNRKMITVPEKKK